MTNSNLTQKTDTSITEDIVRLGAEESLNSAVVCKFIGIVLLIVGSVFAFTTLSPPADQPATETHYLRIGSIALAAFGAVFLYVTSRAESKMRNILDD